MTKARGLAEGLYFGEGPRWYQGRLWFSDFYDHAVKSVDVSGAIRKEIPLDDQPSGLGWLPDGRMVLVAMHHRQVLRVDCAEFRGRRRRELPAGSHRMCRGSGPGGRATVTAAGIRTALACDSG